MTTGTVITMSFDSQGRRTEYKSVTNGAQNTWLRFLYDGYLCVQVLYSNEPYNVFKEFVWDPTESVATRPLVFRYAPNSLNLFYAFDGNKNVSDVFYRMTSNGIGAHYDYAPFGGTTRTHCDSSASFDIVALNPFRFSSEYYDSELDLVYYNFRHYSPSLGRFLSRDPIEEQGGWNLYLIGGNNLLERTDILGESFLSFTLKAGAKAVSKGILKNFINSQIKTKIERIALKNYVKRFSKEADDLIDILDDPWWVTCIGFIPVVGDAFDLVNVPLQIKRAINKADNLQNRVERIISIQGKKASSLLHAKFKHLIGDDPLTEKTYVELKSIAIGESSMSKRARTIIKLIDQAHRLNEKI